MIFCLKTFMKVRVLSKYQIINFKFNLFILFIYTRDGKYQNKKRSHLLHAKKNNTVKKFEYGKTHL